MGPDNVGYLRLSPDPCPNPKYLGKVVFALQYLLVMTPSQPWCWKLSMGSYLLIHSKFSVLRIPSYLCWCLATQLSYYTLSKDPNSVTSVHT